MMTIELIARDLNIDVSQATQRVEEIRRHLGANLTEKTIWLAIWQIEKRRKTVKDIANEAAKMMSDEDYEAICRLSFVLGLRKNAIKEFGSIVERILGSSMSYQELHDTVEKIPRRPFSNPLPTDLRIQDAYLKTQKRVLQEWDMPGSIAELAGAKLKNGESLTDGGRAGFITDVFREESRNFDKQKLRTLSRNCWREIRSPAECMQCQRTGKPRFWQTSSSQE